MRTALVALRSFMETDPRGQLGGLDTSDAVRRRLAAESRAWRCQGCGGRSNEDIIRETEAAAKAAEAEAGEGASGSGGPREVEVPAELKMGFRDEMEKAAAAAAAAGGGAAASGGAGEDAESAELAEGFVQTVPRANLDTSAGAAQPGQTVPQPTRTVPLPNAAHNTGVPGQQAPLQQRQALHDQGDGVPRWVDRVIAALVISLVAMILKVLLAK